MPQETLYNQVKSSLAQRIEAGDIPPNTRLPSQVALCKEFGVSQITVRRALEELVREGLLFARPGSGTYVAERSQLRSSSVSLGRIGIIFKDVAGGYPLVQPLIAAIRDECLTRKYALELLELPANALEELPEEANLHLAGAVLVSPLDLAVLHRLQQQNVPYVLLQNDLSDGVSHCVCCNYAKGIMQATLHLLNQGREDIRLITAEVQRYSSDQMRMGYEMAHEARGRIVDRSRILEAEYSVELAYQIISKWLKDDNLPDGAIFPTERMASVAMDALHHAGVGIGTEIAIVGFGMPSDKLLPITLTVIDAHNERLGKAAMELLQTMIDGQSPKRRRILIDPELVPAESTQG